MQVALKNFSLDKLLLSAVTDDISSNMSFYSFGILNLLDLLSGQNDSFGNKLLGDPR